MSAEPVAAALPLPSLGDIRRCNRLTGDSILDCGCRRPNLGGWDECPASARGCLSPGLVETCRAVEQQALAEWFGAAEAQLGGFTGDCCAFCGNFRVIRNGTCLLCVDCATTSGCS